MKMMIQRILIASLLFIGCKSNSKKFKEGYYTNKSQKVIEIKADSLIYYNGLKTNFESYCLSNFNLDNKSSPINIDYELSNDHVIVRQLNYKKEKFNYQAFQKSKWDSLIIRQFHKFEPEVTQLKIHVNSNDITLTGRNGKPYNIPSNDLEFSKLKDEISLINNNTFAIQSDENTSDVFTLFEIKLFYKGTVIYEGIGYDFSYYFYNLRNLMRDVQST